MQLDLRLERALERVEIVTGVGTRDAGRMCVMSLVDCLAGEEHTDKPARASHVIRAFVIPLNDKMPHPVRQRLKPFAPRILDTNDWRDERRTELLRRALFEEILPRHGRLRSARPRLFPGLFWRLLSLLSIRRLDREAEWKMDRAVALADGGELAHYIAAAHAVGRLLARTVRKTKDPQEAERLWNYAIDLLDKMCDIGAENRHQPNQGELADRIPAKNTARASETLDH